MVTAPLLSLLLCFSLTNIPGGNFPEPEVILSCCQVGDFLVLGTNQSRIYTVSLNTLIRSNPISIDPSRRYGNSLWNFIHSLAPLPGNRVACSLFDEIVIYDFNQSSIAHKISKNKDITHLVSTDKLLIAVSWKNNMVAYDQSSLEKVIEIDLGGNERRRSKWVDTSISPHYDLTSMKLVVTSNSFRSRFIGDVADTVKQVNRLDLGLGHHYTFIWNGKLNQMVSEQGEYRVERSDLKSGKVGMKYTIFINDRLSSVAAISSNLVVTLFENNKRMSAKLHVFDDEFVELTSLDPRIDCPNAVMALLDSRVVVWGLDGIEIITFNGHLVSDRRIIRLPLPYRAAKKESHPLPLTGP